MAVDMQMKAGTCVSVSLSICARSARSGPDRYFWCPKRRSSSKTCACEKAARERFLRVRSNDDASSSDEPPATR